MKNLKNLRTFFRISNAAFGITDAIYMDGEITPPGNYTTIRELHKAGLDEVEREEPDTERLQSILLELETVASKSGVDVSKFQSGGVMTRQPKPFPEFWYESNATYGRVKSLGSLCMHLANQIKEPNMIDSIDKFLDRSRSVPETHGTAPSFGTRREHTGEQTLRMYLAEHGLLDEFLEMWNETNEQ